jgi:hypothetical protein
MNYHCFCLHPVSALILIETYAILLKIPNTALSSVSPKFVEILSVCYLKHSTGCSEIGDGRIASAAGRLAVSTNSYSDEFPYK